MNDPRQPTRDLVLKPFLDFERSEEKESLDLLRYWRIIVKRKWGILGIALIVGIIAAIHAYSQEPVYRATATLLVEPRINSRFAPIQDPVSASSYEVYRAYQYFHTQRAVLTSRSFAEKIVDNLRLWEHPEFDHQTQRVSRAPLQLQWRAWLPDWLAWLDDPVEATGPPPAQEQLRNAAISRIKGGLSVELVENTQLLNISYQSSDPGLAAEIANAVANVYIEHDLETRLETYQQATSWLTDRTVGLHDRLQSSEMGLQQYREREQLVNIEGGKSTTDKQLEDTFNRLIRAQTVRAELETLNSEVETLKTLPAISVAENPTVLSYDTVKTAYSAAQAAQQDARELASRYGPKHPKMVAAQQQVSAARATLGKEVAIVLDNVSKEYEIALKKEESIRAEFERLKDRSQELNRKMFELRTLEKDVEANRELYDLFVTRFKETNVASDLDTPSARVIDPALVPGSPVWPNPQRTVMIAVAAALFAGMLLAFLLEFLDNTIKTPEDLEEKLGVTHLVTLPLLRGKENQQVERYVIDSPNSSFSEGIRTLRTGVLLSGLDNPHKIVAVTSTVPSEGKTTVSINLALALSHLERVLIIDADMRRASVGRHLGIPKDAPGLSNLVAGTAEKAECIFSFADNSLHILPAGLIPPNPQELLSSRRFADLLVELSDRYDRIVIDTAPTLAVSDALLVSSQASAVVYVIKADATPIQLAQSAIKRLRQSDAAIVGAVLNQLNASKSRQYGYYHYGRYYKRYSDSYYGGGEKA